MPKLVKPGVATFQDRLGRVAQLSGQAYIGNAFASLKISMVQGANTARWAGAVSAAKTIGRDLGGRCGEETPSSIVLVIPGQPDWLAERFQESFQLFRRRLWTAISRAAGRDAQTGQFLRAAVMADLRAQGRDLVLLDWYLRGGWFSFVATVTDAGDSYRVTIKISRIKDTVPLRDVVVQFHRRFKHRDGAYRLIREGGSSVRVHVMSYVWPKNCNCF